MTAPAPHEDAGGAAGRIAVTGAGGFVGRALCAFLADLGCQPLRAISRTDVPVADAHRLRRISDVAEWEQALQGCDTVVHLAARVHVMQEDAADPLEAFREVNVRGTAALVRGARSAGVRRLVYVSTIKVHGEGTTAQPFVESDPIRPEDPYARSKAEAEELVRAVPGLDWVVVRPPLVFGPGVGANFLRLMRAVDRGMPLPFGAVDNRRSLVGARNLASLLHRCAVHPAAAGQAFLAVDGPPWSTPELVKAMARALGRSPRLIPVPPSLLVGAATVLGRRAPARRLLGSLVADGSKAAERLAWRPVSTAEEEMDRTAAWFRGESRDLP